MTQALIQVSHLPSAVSFYASITQPFGIRFLSSSPSGTHLYFGFPAFSPSPSETILTLVATTNPTPTTITFTATSRETVQEFYTRANRAADFDTTSTIHHPATGSVAQIYDLDGNLIEAHHSLRGPPDPPPPAVEPASTPPPSKPGLIEAWRADVDRSGAINTSSKPGLISRTNTFPMSRIEKDAAERGGIVPGLSNGTLFGTVLGAAAGALAAYAMVRSDDPEIDQERHASLPMRASAADARPRYTPPAATLYAESVPPYKVYADERERYYAPEPQMGAMERGVVEIGRTQRRMISAGDEHSRVENKSRTVQYTVTRTPDVITETRSETVDYSDEDEQNRNRRRRSSRTSEKEGHLKSKSRSGTSSEISRRSRSRSDKPLAIMPAPSHTSSTRRSRRAPMEVVDEIYIERAQYVPLPESVAPSRASARFVPLPESVATDRTERRRKKRHGEGRDDDTSFVSARTSRSKSTVKGASSSSARKAERAYERSISVDQERDPYIIAQETPLPASVIEGGRHGWDVGVDNDDMESVAPSDSVSCVGERRDREERRERRDRRKREKELEMDFGRMERQMERGFGRMSLVESGSPRLVAGSVEGGMKRGAMSDVERLRRRF